MPQGTVAAAALPLYILVPRLTELYIPRTLCQILRKNATFQEIELRCQQIAWIRDIAEGEHNIPISINALARAFEFPRSRVPGHSLMPWSRQHNKGSLQLLTDIANNKFSIGSNKTPAKVHQSAKEINEYYPSQLKALITRGWVSSFIHRHPKNSSVCKYRKCSSTDQSRI
jgi:hypothetical protein